VRTVAVIARNTHLEGTVILPGGEQLPIRGRVVWSTPPDHLRRVPAEFGVELVDVPEKYYTTLVRFFADQP
jgi:hypothetical protein